MIKLRHWIVTYKTRFSTFKNTMEFIQYGLEDGSYRYVVYNHFLDWERGVTKEEGNEMFRFIKSNHKYVKIKKVI
jgi:hypothetical protein